MDRKIFKYLIIALLLLPLNSLRAQNLALGVDAPRVVTLDEAFRVVYTATGKVDKFNPPTISDFNVLAGPTSSTMSSTSIVNGKRTHTYEVSYTYVLQAKSVGKFNIGTASVVVDNKTTSSKSISIEVVKPQPSKSSGSSGSSTRTTSGIASDDIVLKLQLNKSRVIEGEPIIAILKLYTKVNIAGFEDAKFPTFNGFWSQEIETPTNIEFVRESLNGQIYSSAVLRKYMLIPQQTGAVIIEPAELVCQVQVRSSGGQSRSMFDDFFDSYQTLRKRVITPKMTVNVSSLPAGAPASFTGGVGEFKMEVKLSRDSVAAHEAAALIVEVSGTGNINMIEPPKLNLPPDFELYDVKRSEKINGMTGSKKFEFPFIPRSAGDFTMEAPKFTYYSPKQNKYITITPKPLNIKVGRSTETNAVVIAGGGLNKQFVKDLGSDIRFISTDSSSLVTGESLLLVSIWFYLSYGLIIVLLCGVLYLLHKTIQRRSDVMGSKNRKAKKVAKARLKNAEVFLKQNLYTAFYEELHKAIIGYVSDKFSLAISDINRENISEKLTSRGSSQELIGLLFSTLDACEYARYAPSDGFDAMENHYKDAIRVISEIES